MLDSVAAIYSANENDRAEVRGFLSALARRAYEGDRSVLLLALKANQGQLYQEVKELFEDEDLMAKLGTFMRR